VLSPFVLKSPRVRLEPLTPEHAGPLAEAAAADRSAYQFTWVPDGPADAGRYVAAALADQAGGRTLAWAVRRRADDQVVGCTRVLDLEVFGWPPPWPPGVGRGPAPSDDQPPTVAEIGSTWYAASAQRTGLNAECKLLLLTHAFETWGTLRVTLKTDARNAGGGGDDRPWLTEVRVVAGTAARSSGCCAGGTPERPRAARGGM